MVLLTTIALLATTGFVLAVTCNHRDPARKPAPHMTRRDVDRTIDLVETRAGCAWWGK